MRFPTTAAGWGAFMSIKRSFGMETLDCFSGLAELVMADLGGFVPPERVVSGLEELETATLGGWGVFALGLLIFVTDFFVGRDKLALAVLVILRPLDDVS